MNISSTQHGTITVVAVSGRIDTTNYTEFEEQVVALISAEKKRFVFDFSKLEYLSSAGLRALLKIGQELGDAGGELAYASVSEYIDDIFKIAGFSKVYKFYDTPAAAIQFLG